METGYVLLMKKLRDRLLNISDIKLGQWVALSIFIVLFYCAAEFVVSTLTGISHDTLTTCIFTFFGTELCSCGFIKVFKIRNE